MDRGSMVVVVVDGSKLGRAAFVQICPIEAVHEIVTDTDGDSHELAAIRHTGVTVTVV
jgi:DeoR family transcriptional regulator of aga operon